MGAELTYSQYLYKKVHMRGHHACMPVPRNQLTAFKETIRM
jgi:hypothetical protein